MVIECACSCVSMRACGNAALCTPALSLHSLWWYKRIFTPLKRWSVPAIVRDTDLIQELTSPLPPSSRVTTNK